MWTHGLDSQNELLTHTPCTNLSDTGIKSDYHSNLHTDLALYSLFFKRRLLREQ